MKRIALMFCVLCCLLVGCQSNKYPELNMSVLDVGVSPDFPPFIFKKGMKITGIEADLAEKLSDELGVQMKYTSLAWLDLIPALEDGRIDIIMSAMSKTPERSKLVLFTDPVFSIAQMALIQTKDLTKYPDSKAIFNSKARIGVVSETTGDFLVRKKCKKAQRIAFSNFEAAVEALEKGRVDIVVSDSSSISHVKNDKIASIYEPLNEEKLAWAVNKKNTKLIKILNNIIAQWKRDGVLNAVRDKWISGLMRSRIK